MIMSEGRNRAIEVFTLTKNFKELTAVDGILFEVGAGEIFGLIGANGAGKTTTIMMLCTLIRPTSGSARICGYDIIKESKKVRESIGVVFEEPSIDIRLTGRENLDFHARMYRLPKKMREERVSEVLDLVELRDKEDLLVKDYSGGMQRRLEIARSLLNHPKVLFLDEPTIGLDVQTRRKMWDYVKKMNREEGTTLFLTTHYIDEADQICNRVGIMDHGEIKAIDRPERLKYSAGESVISLKLSTGSKEDFSRLLSELDWVKEIDESNGSFRVGISYGEKRVPEIVRLARENGFSISSISSHKVTLEDAFIRHNEGG
ncbi:MAG: ATP-binding cassette domain-containing protein [Candidatus Methanolliviera hydrocarbonicum]|uniref:ATP-binding cassette domain-containing protein n=1 Tax=Candidatus Methanolliviera hydrocarbonicum TaxID=2491085 RepID=A0A520KXI1_9EURY|nr:MAG: ATP-binding cassette domain-containing protein [Candidatus Methanolliviera hydrocarbonicum]